MNSMHFLSLVTTTKINAICKDRSEKKNGASHRISLSYTHHSTSNQNCAVLLTFILGNRGTQPEPLLDWNCKTPRVYPGDCRSSSKSPSIHCPPATQQKGKQHASSAQEVTANTQGTVWTPAKTSQLWSCSTDCSAGAVDSLSFEASDSWEQSLLPAVSSTFCCLSPWCSPLLPCPCCSKLASHYTFVRCL